MFEILRYVGALYMGWLAIKALKRASSSKSSLSLGEAYAGTLPALFARGAGIHLTNPKSILGWAAIYTIVAPAQSTAVTLLGYFGLLYFGSIVVFIGYAFLFSSERAVQTYTQARRWFEFGFACFFGFASFKILTARFQ